MPEKKTTMGNWHDCVTISGIVKVNWHLQISLDLPGLLSELPELTYNRIIDSFLKRILNCLLITHDKRC